LSPRWSWFASIRKSSIGLQATTLAGVFKKTHELELNWWDYTRCFEPVKS
jgi:hypothetical protein